MPLATFLVGGTPIQLRGLAWLALNDGGRVGAGTFTDDTGGGGTASWVYGGTIPCRIDPLAGNEALIAARVSDRSTHIITVPPNTAITTSNRFVVLNRGTFEVTSIMDRTDEALRFFEAVQVT